MKKEVQFSILFIQQQTFHLQKKYNILSKENKIYCENKYFVY